MDSIVTALIINREPIREFDELIYLYTREQGFIVARAVSSRKANSKLSAHCDPVTRARVRLAHGKAYIITDAVPEDRFQKIRSSREKLQSALRLFSFIQSFFPRESGTDQMWDFLNDQLHQGIVPTADFLSLLGFHRKHAECFSCHRKESAYFSFSQHVFFCSLCGSKKSPDDVLCIV